MKPFNNITKRVELWWFYLNDDMKDTLRYSGKVFASLFGIIAILLFFFGFPYLVYKAEPYVVSFFTNLATLVINIFK